MFEICNVCGKSLVNLHNIGAIVGCGIVGGAVGAYALSFFGFTGAGISAGSWAAAWQGPQVIAGSIFAMFQSLGATGDGSLLFGAVGSVGAAGTALFLLRQQLCFCFVKTRIF